MPRLSWILSGGAGVYLGPQAGWVQTPSTFPLHLTDSLSQNVDQTLVAITTPTLAPRKLTFFVITVSL